MRCLGWHDRQRAFWHCLRRYMPCATAWARRGRLCRSPTAAFAAWPLLRRLASSHPRAGSRSAFLERILDGVHRDVAVWMRRRLPARCWRCFQRACPRLNWKTPGPQRRRPSTTFGHAETGSIHEHRRGAAFASASETRIGADILMRRRDDRSRRRSGHVASLRPGASRGLCSIGDGICAPCRSGKR